MDAAVWISLLVGVVVVLFVVWVVLLETSFIVEPGTLALVLRRGVATGRAVPPGRHFIQPWRKATLQVYPSRELSLVAGGRPALDPRVEFSDDPLRVYLADRAQADVSFTVRCQLDPGKLRQVHDNFGPEGLWSALRDATRRALLAEFAARAVTVDDVFGDGFPRLEQGLAEGLRSALGELGFELRSFTLRTIDLGETGEVIQATVRAESERAREEVLAGLRRARLENDNALRELAGGDADLALRYRQFETWQDLVHRWDGGRPIPVALTHGAGAAVLVEHALDHHGDESAQGAATDDAAAGTAEPT